MPPRQPVRPPPPDNLGTSRPLVVGFTHTWRRRHSIYGRALATAGSPTSHDERSFHVVKKKHGAAKEYGRESQSPHSHLVAAEAQIQIHGDRVRLLPVTVLEVLHRSQLVQRRRGARVREPRGDLLRQKKRRRKKVIETGKVCIFCSLRTRREDAEGFETAAQVDGWILSCPVLPSSCGRLARKNKQQHHGCVRACARSCVRSPGLGRRHSRFASTTTEDSRRRD